MKKLLFALFLLGCSSGNISPSTPASNTVTVHPPKHTQIELSDIQKVCLSKGDFSFSSGKTWLEYEKSCKDEQTLMSFYNDASGIGERDAIRTIGAYMIQCFIENNSLSDTEFDKEAQPIIKNILKNNEIVKIKNNKYNSCFSNKVVTTFTEAGFICGFSNSTNSQENLENALTVYLKLSNITGQISDQFSEKDLNLVVQQASVCYNVVRRVIMNKLQIPYTTNTIQAKKD